MRRDQQFEVLMRRSSECEQLALVAADVSIRNKCAELAVEYRSLADRMKQLDAFDERLS
jgi:hypothetical protein